MSASARNISACILLIALTQTGRAQSEELHGQASAYLSAHPKDPSNCGAGIRYIPDFLAERDLGGGLNANLELSLNGLSDVRFEKDQRPSSDAALKLYRAWLRIASDVFEARLGLQKINFGSALFFRPLMWFDRVDPRDPLQLTDGVYGLLARYYFPTSANIWFWSLYGNNEVKGWELSPTERRSVELGGRVQARLYSGEIGLTYHHRRADLGALSPALAGATSAPEDRLGIDGKWDVGAGVWGEAVLIREQSDLLPLKYQRQWTLGSDYTISFGSGLYVAAEYTRFEKLEEPFASAQGTGFSAFTARYPIGLLDQVSLTIYRDWTQHDWYRLVTWQRTYDNWIFYALVFWDPEKVGIYQNVSSSSSFSGSGIQLMVVFNH